MHALSVWGQTTISLQAGFDCFGGKTLIYSYATTGKMWMDVVVHTNEDRLSICFSCTYDAFFDVLISVGHQWGT